MRKNAMFAPTIAAVALAMTGCNPRDAAALKEDTQHIASDTGQALGSATLAGKVNGVLSIRKGVDMSGLHVEAQDGVVTVSGHVRNGAERRRVVQTVDGITGVDKVVNHLTIQP